MADAGEIQALWKSLVRLYPAWTLPWDAFFNPSTWRMLGVDMMASTFADAKTRKLAARLDGVAPDTVQSLSELAKLNAERSGDVFKLVAIAYISLPIALTALVSDAAPNLIRETIADNLWRIAYWVGLAAVTPLVYFAGMWRAKQLAWSIDLYRLGAAPR